MATKALKGDFFRQVILSFTWFCVLLSVNLPALLHADLCVSEDDNDRRTKVAYVVAGLTVIGLVAGIACLANSSGHHHHHTRSSGMSSVDNYRPYSSYSYSSDSSFSSDYTGESESSDRSERRDHRRDRHHSGFYSTNPYSDFSRNNVSSWSGDSSSERTMRSRICKTSKEAHTLSGTFTIHSTSMGQEGNATAFVQLPSGASHALGCVPLSGRASLPYGPYSEKGTYTFGVNIDQGNPSSAHMKIGSLEIAVDGSTVQRHEFSAPPHAPANYEPSPCCFDY